VRCCRLTAEFLDALRTASTAHSAQGGNSATFSIKASSVSPGQVRLLGSGCCVGNSTSITCSLRGVCPDGASYLCLRCTIPGQPNPPHPAGQTLAVISPVKGPPCCPQGATTPGTAKRSGFGFLNGNHTNHQVGSPQGPGRQQSGGNEGALSHNSDRDSVKGGAAGSGAASTADGFMGRSSISTNTAGTGVASLADQLRGYKVGGRRIGWVGAQVSTFCTFTYLSGGA
jgi:hypothetical protein